MYIDVLTTYTRRIINHRQQYYIYTSSPSIYNTKLLSTYTAVTVINGIPIYIIYDVWVLL